MPAVTTPDSGTGFRRLLVANRGEIALRVFRTCARLGIDTVAVATPIDRGALHARGVATVEITDYLDPAEHVRAAREAGADAVHPGYGFRSESATFAEAVTSAGIAWIGPPAEALRRGGDKLEARRLAAAAGVPVLPAGEPSVTGFPLLVKAAAGGGGRGMRVVRAPPQLDEALAAASREAEAAFGDGRVYCERLLERPRHVEVQLVGHSGGVVSLGLRDCSVQRRHQKVVEEAPAPLLEPALAARIAGFAETFGHAIGYRSLGTAEFLVEDGRAFFLELNARIQVEHPVTEAVTGLDLVELQLLVAAGRTLPPLPEAPRGHAIEARLYAEDPRTFLPQAGRIELLRLPGSIRVDAGMAEGDEVGTSYDPLIAKLVAHGHSRDDALERLGEALAETEVRGVTTNLAFLRWLVRHPAFRAGRLSTAFLAEQPPLGLRPLRLPEGPYRGAWRLNLPSPSPAPPPEVDSVAAGAVEQGARALSSPMPGTVIRVHVAPGELVTARQPLVVLEAMKMETPVTAPAAARVSAVHVAEGDRVERGALLVELEPDSTADDRRRGSRS